MVSRYYPYCNLLYFLFLIVSPFIFFLIIHLILHLMYFAIKCPYLYLHSFNVFIKIYLCTLHIFCVVSVIGPKAVDSARK